MEPSFEFTPAIEVEQVELENPEAREIVLGEQIDEWRHSDDFDLLTVTRPNEAMRFIESRVSRMQPLADFLATQSDYNPQVRDAAIMEVFYSSAHSIVEAALDELPQVVRDSNQAMQNIREMLTHMASKGHDSGLIKKHVAHIQENLQVKSVLRVYKELVDVVLPYLVQREVDKILPEWVEDWRYILTNSLKVSEISGPPFPLRLLTEYNGKERRVDGFYEQPGIHLHEWRTWLKGYLDGVMVQASQIHVTSRDDLDMQEKLADIRNQFKKLTKKPDLDRRFSSSQQYEAPIKLKNAELYDDTVRQITACFIDRAYLEIKQYVEQMRHDKMTLLRPAGPGDASQLLRATREGETSSDELLRAGDSSSYLAD